MPIRIENFAEEDETVVRFVQLAMHDRQFTRALQVDPARVVTSFAHTPRLARVLPQLVPFVTGERTFGELNSLTWWSK